MIKTLFTSWSLMRAIRLVLGIVALVQSVVQKDIALGVVAGFLLLTAIANVGCCGSNGCAVSDQRKKESEIAYEELDHKK